MQWHRRILLALMTLALGTGQILAPLQAAWVGTCCRALAEEEGGTPSADCCCSKKNQGDNNAPESSAKKPSCCQKRTKSSAKSPRNACCRRPESGKPVVRVLTRGCGCFKAPPEPFVNRRPVTSLQRFDSEIAVQFVAEVSDNAHHNTTRGEFFEDLPPPSAIWIRHCALLL